MNMTKKSVAAAILALAGTNAMASGYVGVGFGTVDPDLDAISNFEDSSGLEIIGGLNISPNMAFELSYVDLGESSDTIAPVWTVSSSGIAGALLVKAPIGESAEVFFKLGLLNWDTSASEQGFGEFYSESGTDFFFGFGAAFKLSQTVSLGVPTWPHAVSRCKRCSRGTTSGMRSGVSAPRPSCSAGWSCQSKGVPAISRVR